MTADRAKGMQAGRAGHRWLLEAGAWGTAYAVAGALGLYLGGTPDQPSPFQPAAGVALAAVLARGWRVLPGIGLGAVALHALAPAFSAQAGGITAAWWLPAALALAALAQALLGAAGITRFVQQPLTLAEPRDISQFFACCAAAAVAGTALAVAAYWISGAITGAGAGAGAGADAAALAAAWWFGQASGTVVMAPVVLAWAAPSHADWPIVAVRFIEPYERNRLAPGTNSSANPAAGPVIAAALRSGGVAATPAFPLRLPDGAAARDAQGVVIYRALYRGEPVPGTQPESEAAREASAYGLVFATLRMGEVLDSVSATLARGYTLCLVDLSTEPAPRRIAGAPACDTQGSALTYRRPLQFADRRWELRVGMPSAADAAAASGFAWPFALFGFSGTAALGAMLLAVTGRTRRVELAVAEAERAREAAVAANQAKSEFLSRMSHELRTPLNAVVGFAQLMESDQEHALGPRHRRWIELVRQAGWHLLEMINDILDLSRIESDRLELRAEALCLQPLLEQTLAMVERLAAQRQVTVTLVPAGAALSVLGDATRVKQIVTNLLSNAVKYNVDNGRVEILCRAVGGRVEIEVRDTGLGMSAAQLEQLFQPFNRLGREHTELQGTGIGLVISRRLAEMMGGRLQASSEAGKGSSFVLTLPRADGGQAVRSEFGALDRGPVEEAQRDVLYVEDNAINAELLRGILAQRPAIRLEVLTTGLGALAAARAQAPDLILLDLHLPDIHGLDVLRRLKAEPACASIPVVVVSADAMEAQVDAALRTGAVDGRGPSDGRQASPSRKLGATPAATCGSALWSPLSSFSATPVSPRWRACVSR